MSVEEIIKQVEDDLVLCEGEGGWVEMGGPGSGHWRHAGRKGKKGGSAPNKGAKMAGQPGGFYEAMNWKDVPDKLYHGTAEQNLSSILDKGIEPRQRGQGTMPLVSTSPSIGAASSWGGGTVLEIDVSKLSKEGRVWSAAMFEDIALELPVPRNAITQVWTSDWFEEKDIKNTDIKLRSGGDGWTLVMRPEKL